MVERSIRIREVRGSMPRFSSFFIDRLFNLWRFFIFSLLSKRTILPQMYLNNDVERIRKMGKKHSYSRKGCIPPVGKGGYPRIVDFFGGCGSSKKLPPWVQKNPVFWCGFFKRGFFEYPPRVANWTPPLWGRTWNKFIWDPLPPGTSVQTPTKLKNHIIFNTSKYGENPQTQIEWKC